MPDFQNVGPAMRNRTAQSNPRKILDRIPLFRKAVLIVRYTRIELNSQVEKNVVSENGDYWPAT